MQRITLILLTLIIILPVLAQDQHPYVKNFTASPLGEKLFVSWTTKAGFSCQDIIVEISTDNIHFESKGIYYGLCGDFEEKSYTLTVDSPYHNTLNFLRLNLGTYGYSYVISTQFIMVKDAKVIPHPASSGSILYFNNDLKEVAQIQFYGYNGKIILEESTSNNQMILAHSQLPPIVFYTIRFEGIIKYRGKIIYTY